MGLLSQLQEVLRELLRECMVFLREDFDRTLFWQPRAAKMCQK